MYLVLINLVALQPPDNFHLHEEQSHMQSVTIDAFQLITTHDVQAKSCLSVSVCAAYRGHTYMPGLLHSQRQLFCIPLSSTSAETEGALHNNDMKDSSG